MPVLAVIAAIPLLCGCNAVKLAAGKEGVDVSRIRAGVPRAEVDATLGKPVRECRPAAGTLFCTYEYDLGCEPAFGEAFAMTVLAVATVGISEAAFRDLECTHAFNRVVISFDAQGRMIGLFREFDPLPSDGRHGGSGSLEELKRREESQASPGS